jgi:hypothetical protein
VPHLLKHPPLLLLSQAVLRRYQLTGQVFQGMVAASDLQAMDELLPDRQCLNLIHGEF